jgi:hypothetical protein
MRRYPFPAIRRWFVFSQQQLDEKKVVGFVFGHAGDGNLHVVMVGDPADDGEWASLEEINHSIVHRAVEVGGTCTGEHGIGIGKRKFMQLEHGEGYKLMKQIKNLMDPKGLMNPGKMFCIGPISALGSPFQSSTYYMYASNDRPPFLAELLGVLAKAFFMAFPNVLIM